MILHSYSAVLIRYHHDLGVGEFANIGVVVWDIESRRLHFALSEGVNRFSRLFNDFDKIAYKSMVKDVRRCLEEAERELKRDGSFYKGDSLDELLHQVLVPKAGCFQWSHVMPGAVEDVFTECHDLFHYYIGQHEEKKQTDRLTDSDVKTEVRDALKASGLEESKDYQSNAQVMFHQGQTKSVSRQLTASWVNGVQQFAAALSLDMAKPGEIEDKAFKWTGIFEAMPDAVGVDHQITPIVAPPPPEAKLDFHESYAFAVERLKSMPNVRKVLTIDQVDVFVKMVRDDVTRREQSN